MALLLCILVGLATGLLWKDLPLVAFNKEVKLFEVANICATVGIGIFIPLLVKRWIDDSKSVKTYLAEEIKSMITTLATVQQKIKSGFESGTITQKDKDDINYIFHTFELQLATFREQLKISYPSAEKKQVQKLLSSYNAYKDFLTGGPLMISTFTTIDDRFYRENNQQYSSFEGHLKILIHTVLKY
ncbi:hypothetical protein [Flavihumibacter sp. ZG627]|uniref:hypothetical protein n=1 Tax=Flavihumibacter sp. ZG627 TaxID=1463156 RepID=UPI0012E09074|nr:hypothetical protein [Flavihumibacter sp. ZG627]